MFWHGYWHDSWQGLCHDSFNTHHRPKKAFVLPFPNATHQRSVGSLHKPTENAFFNLCMKNTRPHNNGRKRPALCSRKNIRLCCLPEQYPNRSSSFRLSFICLPPHKSLLQEIKHSNKGCRFYPLPITSILFTFAPLWHSRSHRARSLNRIRVIGIAASMRHTG